MFALNGKKYGDVALNLSHSGKKLIRLLWDQRRFSRLNRFCRRNPPFFLISKPYLRILKPGFSIWKINYSGESVTNKFWNSEFEVVSLKLKAGNDLALSLNLKLTWHNLLLSQKRKDRYVEDASTFRKKLHWIVRLVLLARVSGLIWWKLFVLFLEFLVKLISKTEFDFGDGRYAYFTSIFYLDNIWIWTTICKKHVDFLIRQQKYLEDQCSFCSYQRVATWIHMLER